VSLGHRAAAYFTISCALFRITVRSARTPLGRVLQYSFVRRGCHTGRTWDGKGRLTSAETLGCAGALCRLDDFAVLRTNGLQLGKGQCQRSCLRA